MAITAGELVVILTAKDAMTSVLRNVQREMAGAQTTGEKLSVALKVGLAGAAGVATGAAIGMGKALLDMTMQAAPLAGVKAAFEGIAEASGQSADAMLKALDESSAGMIRQTDLMRTYNLAAQLVGTQFANQLPEAMQYLSKVSAATGQSMDYMLESLVRGVGRLSPLILDNLGIQVDLTAAYEQYAAQIGKTAKELSKEEQQTALMNVVMEKLRENTANMPAVAGSAAAGMARLNNVIQNAKDQIGMAFLPALSSAIEAITQIAVDILSDLVPALERLAPKFADLGKEILACWNILTAFAAKIGEATRAVGDFFAAVERQTSSATELQRTIATAQTQMDALGRSSYGNSLAFDRAKISIENARRALETYGLVNSQVAEEVQRAEMETTNYTIGQFVPQMRSAYELLAEEAELFGMSADLAIRMTSDNITEEVRGMYAKMRSTMTDGLRNLMTLTENFRQAEVQAERNFALTQLTSGQDYQIKLYELEAEYRRARAAAAARGDQEELAKLDYKYQQELAMAEYGRQKELWQAQRARAIEARNRAQAYYDGLVALRDQISNELVLKQIEAVQKGEIDREMLNYRLKLLGIQLTAENEIALDIIEINQRVGLSEWQRTQETWKAVNARIDAYKAEAQAALAAANRQIENIPIPRMPEIPPMPEITLPEIKLPGGGTAEKQKEETVTETLERTVERITDIIGRAIEALERVAKYRGADLRAGMERLSDNIIQAVTILYEAITRELGDKWREIVGGAADFSQLASQVVSLFSATTDTVAGLAGFAPVDIAAAAANLRENVATLIRETDIMRAQFEDADGIWQEIARRTAQFAVYATDALSWVRVGVDVLLSVANYQSAKDIRGAITAMIEDARVVSRELVRYFQTWTDATRENVSMAGESASLWNDLFSKVQTIVNAVKSVAGYQSAKDIRGAITAMIEDARVVSRELVRYFQTWTDATRENVSMAGESASLWPQLFSAVKPVVDGICAVADYQAAKDIRGAVTAMIEDARVVSRELVRYFKLWTDTTRANVDMAGDAAEQWRVLFGPLKTIVDGIRAIADYQRARDIKAAAEAMIADTRLVSQAMVAYFKRWTDETRANVKMAGECAALWDILLKPVKTMVEAMIALGGYRTRLRPTRDQIYALLADVMTTVDIMRVGLHDIEDEVRNRFGNVATATSSLQTLIGNTIGIAQGLQEMSWRRVTEHQVKSFIGNLQNVVLWITDPEKGLPSIGDLDVERYLAPVRAVNEIVDSLVQSIRAIQTLPYITAPKLENFTWALSQIVAAIEDALSSEGLAAAVAAFASTLQALFTSDARRYYDMGYMIGQQIVNGLNARLAGLPTAGLSPVVYAPPPAYAPKPQPPIEVSVNVNGVLLATETEKIGIARALTDNIVNEMRRRGWQPSIA